MRIYRITQSDLFKEWLTALKDTQGKFAIVARIRRAGLGNFGDFKNLGGGLFEMRVDSGPGYRVYYERIGETDYAILCGGTKSGQQVDIAQARMMITAKRSHA